MDNVDDTKYLLQYFSFLIDNEPSSKEELSTSHEPTKDIFDIFVDFGTMELFMMSPFTLG